LPVQFEHEDAPAVLKGGHADRAAVALLPLPPFWVAKEMTFLGYLDNGVVAVGHIPMLLCTPQRPRLSAGSAATKAFEGRELR
jgi:hypothetical protein